MTTGATALWAVPSVAALPPAAALDLAHAARAAGDLVAFTQARGAVLRLAPAESYAAVASEVAGLWPDRRDHAPRLDRAS